MPGGRPPKYKKAADLQKQVDAYFEQTDTPALVSMYHFCNLTIQGWSEYTRKTEFSDVCKKAKERVVSEVEEALLHRGANVTGCIFWLKNNAGYRDQIETKTEITLSPDTIALADRIALGRQQLVHNSEKIVDGETVQAG